MVPGTHLTAPAARDKKRPRRAPHPGSLPLFFEPAGSAQLRGRQHLEVHLGRGRHSAGSPRPPRPRPEPRQVLRARPPRMAGEEAGREQVARAGGIDQPLDRLRRHLDALPTAGWQWRRPPPRRDDQQRHLRGASQAPPPRNRSQPGTGPAASSSLANRMSISPPCDQLAEIVMMVVDAEHVGEREAPPCGRRRAPPGWPAASPPAARPDPTDSLRDSRIGAHRRPGLVQRRRAGRKLGRRRG